MTFFLILALAVIIGSILGCMAAEIFFQIISRIIETIWERQDHNEFEEAKRIVELEMSKERQ